MKDLNPDIWLPHYWFFFYSMAHSYPDTPNQVTKRKYYDFVQNIPLFLPHSEIRNQFSHLLDEFPVTPYLANKDSFVYWIHFMKNKLSEIKGKELRSYFQDLDEYYGEYVPQIQLSSRFGIQKKVLVWFLILISFFGVVFLSQTTIKGK
jgi:hypothetical protein